MSPSLILYGSKARGDARADSDVDLLLASCSGDLQKPTTVAGVSLHRYPKPWLEVQAQQGSLFAYHVAFEGVALEDADGLIGRLRSVFRRKDTYDEDILVGSLVMKLLIAADWGANFEARRRFVWALRTTLIAATAADGSPVFAPLALESRIGLYGVAELISNREQVNFDQCRSVGEQALARFLAPTLAHLEGPVLREHLMRLGGMALDSVRVVEEEEAISEGNLAIYG